MTRRLRASPAKRSSPARIVAVIEDERWRKDPVTLRLMRRAMRLGLAAPGKRRALGTAVTILLTADKRLKSLNHDFRGKNKPTNVLSFPSAQPGYLGDIAIAYETVAREARAQRKPFSHHAAHLALHGVLHIKGHDHEETAQAVAMESLETRLLSMLGIASPYVLRPLTRKSKAA
jgi:probable rRNA maturation factor